MYTPHKTKLPTKATLVAMQKICDYLHNDEHDHFEENEKPSNHIFREIEAVEAYLATTELFVTI